MRRLSRRSALAVVGASLVAGCNVLDPSGSGQTEHGAAPSNGTDADIHVLTKLASEAWQQKWNQEIEPGFEANSSHTVHIELPARKRSRVRTLYDEGNLPEVYTADGLEIPWFVLRGETEPVDDLVSGLGESNGPLVVDRPIRMGNSIQIVPHGLTVGGVLNYRSDIYDRLDLSVPETWSALIRNARVIEESERVDARGFAVPAVRSDEKARDDFTNLFFNSGGRFWRWRDRDSGTAEIAMRREDVRSTLEAMQTLATYSPDPAAVGYPKTAGDWTLGNVAQCFFPNAWLAGLAYDRPAEEATRIAVNTRQAPVPRMDSTTEPRVRGWARITGTPLFAGTNTAAAREFIRYLYGNPSKQADKNNPDMEYLPPYEGVLDTDEYRNTGIYRAEDGVFLDRERHVLRDITPDHRGNLIRTPATQYALHRPIGGTSVLTELVHAVLVEGVSIDSAIDTAMTDLQDLHDRAASL